ncbi:holo-ACP synthase [Lacrimispora defluvii]|uniref:Holo-[acyl-carrier-protein] synthase n=1 Tax=Lacrimispora defluvii TaxID=2719233 RepID=A0ABX1VVM7_9FIRM|nr:holo-ACP synthase [Lacrimispora defluvii]NNJ31912.1 holo-[acyl-carrier-protein] synthase [Lacrimispora defluvii]
MMIGIGTDILNIHNIENAVKDLKDPFVQKTYTKGELELILSRPVPLNSFATRFAGKEAVFKALLVHPDAVRLNEIEILENENGQPVVFFHGNAKKLAEDKGIKTALISLSYDTDYAIAYAVLSE